MVDGIDTTSVTAEIADKTWYVRIWHWILSWFIEEYEVTVYFVSEIITHPETGESSMKRVKRVFLMKDISKKSQTEICSGTPSPPHHGEGNQLYSLSSGICKSA